MKRYRKKPLVIEAEQWFKVTYDREAGHGDSPQHSCIYHLEVGYFRHPEKKGDTICSHCEKKLHHHGWIDTLEGGHTVCPGDWIIRGIKGEYYPCKPDVFEQTYEVYVLPSVATEDDPAADYIAAIRECDNLRDAAAIVRNMNICEERKKK